ncbi:membrane protein containing Extracellular ligand-binding receptor domain protein [Candidatus Magnetomorum sp. HK-1]|nr:membrane protein containing Extracellular ligand-binding receptor domain protein [Candidatus Magnetomorum sp. HK-1]
MDTTLSKIDHILKRMNITGEKIILFLCISIIIYIFFVFYKGQTKHIIAVVGPMSGIHEKNGKAMIKGIYLYLKQESISQLTDELNLEIRIFDDQNNVEKADQIARDIVSNDDILMVLGHYYSSTSICASKYYKEKGIPVITASATDDTLTADNKWYFRVIPGNEMQGRFIANYILSTLKKKKVAIIYEKGDYGDTLRDSFTKEALKLKMHVKPLGFESKDLDKNVSDVVSRLRDIENFEMVFIAAHNTSSAKLIASLKYPGASFSIIGSDSFSNELFFHFLQEESFQEQASPGYHSEDIYGSSPFIIEAGEEKAQKFKKDYMNSFKESPTWVPACYYDSIKIAMHSIRNSQINDIHDIVQKRKNILKNLQNINTIENSIDGVTGSIYFDKLGSVQRPFYIGVYSNQHYVPALSQYQPIVDTKNVKNIVKKMLKGEIIKIGENYAKKVRVVYTGIDINTITDFNLADQTYVVDFYLWFRYEQGISNITNIEFENTVEPLYLDDKNMIILTGVTKVLDKYKDNIRTKAYRIKRTFKSEFDFHSFPFDQHKLKIKFRHRTLTNDKLIFISDINGMSGKDENSNLSITGWTLKNIICFKDFITNQSSFGDTDLFNTQNTIKFSRYNSEIHIKRKILPYLIKNLFVTFVLLAITYLTFFIPSDQFSIRVSICMSAFLTTAFSHIKTGSNLPCDYILAIEYVFFGVYAITALSILIAIICYRLYQTENNENLADSAKSIAHQKRKMTTIFGLIAHPMIIISVCFLLYLYQ